MSAVTEQIGGVETEPGPPGRSGPHPLLVIAAAFALGLLLARVVDWRSHAHPRR